MKRIKDHQLSRWFLGVGKTKSSPAGRLVVVAAYWVSLLLINQQSLTRVVDYEPAGLCLFESPSKAAILIAVVVASLAVSIEYVRAKRHAPTWGGGLAVFQKFYVGLSRLVLLAFALGFSSAAIDHAGCPSCQRSGTVCTTFGPGAK